MVVLSLEMDQESSRIELVCVCVCEGGEGRLGCGFIIRKIHSLYNSFSMVTLVVSWSSKLLFFHDFVIHQKSSFRPKSLIRVVF